MHHILGMSELNDNVLCLRLTVAYLKSRDFVDHGLPSQDVKVNSCIFVKS